MPRDFLSTPRDRYVDDRNFRMVVDLMLSMIMQHQFTPTEMREAAVLASIKYESIRVRREYVQLTPELHEQLEGFHKIVDGLPRDA